MLSGIKMYYFKCRETKGKKIEDNFEVLFITPHAMDLGVHKIINVPILSEQSLNTNRLLRAWLLIFRMHTEYHTW